MLGVVVDLDDQPVRPAGRGAQGHGGYQLVAACGVAGVHHHRQVAELVQDRDDGQIHGVAGGGLKGADAPLAEDHLVIAPGHDVLCAHEQLL